MVLGAYEHVHRCWIRRDHLCSRTPPTLELLSIVRGSMMPEGTSCPQTGEEFTTRTSQLGANRVACLCARRILPLVVSATTELFGFFFLHSLEHEDTISLLGPLEVASPNCLRSSLLLGNLMETSIPSLIHTTCQFDTACEGHTALHSSDSIP